MEDGVKLVIETIEQYDFLNEMHSVSCIIKGTHFLNNGDTFLWKTRSLIDDTKRFLTYPQVVDPHDKVRY